MKCKYCEQEIMGDVSYCTNCGKKVKRIRNKKPLIIVGLWTLLVISFLVLTFISLIKNMNNYQANTASKREFIEEIDKLGCKTIDVLEEHPDNAFNFYYVTDNTCPYIIAYAKFNNSEAKNSFYNKLVKDVQNVSGSSRSYSTVNVKNYSEYTYISNEYKSTASSKDYVLYIHTAKKDKEIANRLKNSLGFKFKLNLNFLYYIIAFFIIKILLLIVSWWKINKKMKRPAWVLLIPIYNIICLCEDVMGKKIYALLFFIPFVNLFFIIALYFSIAKVFGKSDVYQILTIFFPSITIPLIAFDDSNYTKPNKNTINT